ncbi:MULTISPECIES: hypothetical protein [unclassified Staphylococcus]|uniref:hypothetical protein n=1 Tax=unclassified Staphylococcus TaxID=91994 RepID=UPI0018824A78|nr:MULTISPECIES: hypothetical protein [unclassified Staphylococcus]MBF2756429.1 hypothetical protein [Staphylococcus haemolyticus]MBF2773676.1 hypothetical protein [Staphylococcus haemolyticus]MBF2775793.1 hypothetical protein [Staphylococcus haemolyticus]MBF2815362.1 hypothetical protein [Staphylococcus haemolyticus]MBF9719865.1 hypothetical protein [Staphylococcus haemolyticus]
MIDIQIQKSELIEAIESIVKEKVYVESDDACEVLATEIVNGLEELNSDETQANNLLGLNSELQHKVDQSNDAIDKVTVSTAGNASSNVQSMNARAK